VFTDRCASSHGADGLGLLATNDKRRGFVPFVHARRKCPGDTQIFGVIDFNLI